MTPPAPAIVSVVTPSFNQAQYLEETIASVLSQDYASTEYMVLDGGSTDQSVEVIRKHESRIAFWVSEPDGGQVNAINRGWRQSKGAIVAYLNSDDVYLPGALAAATRFLAARPDVGIAYGACELFDEDERILSVNAPPEFSLKQLLLGNFIAQPAVFIRRDVLDRIGMLDPAFHYAMDYDLWVRAAVAGVGIARVPGPPLARFRIWRGAKTSNASATGLDERLAILERAFTHGGLPASLLALRPYARARACMTAAYSEFLNGDMAATRRFLVQSIGYSPRIVIDPEFLMLGAATLPGQRGSRALRRMRSWFRRRAGTPARTVETAS